MKKRKLFVDESSYEKVINFLNDAKINWDNDAVFHFDLRTAIFVFAGTVAITLLLTSI